MKDFSFGRPLASHEHWCVTSYPCYQVEKLREELERSQATVGKAQIAQEKTQVALDKAQSELDQLQERAERQGNELRRVSDGGGDT